MRATRVSAIKPCNKVQAALDVRVELSDGVELPTTGKLDFAENRVDSATGTLRLRAKFPNPDYILQPGLFGRIHVPGSLPYQGRPHP